MLQATHPPDTVFLLPQASRHSLAVWLFFFFWKQLFLHRESDDTRKACVSASDPPKTSPLEAGGPEAGKDAEVAPSTSEAASAERTAFLGAQHGKKSCTASGRTCHHANPRPVSLPLQWAPDQGEGALHACYTDPLSSPRDPRGQGQLPDGREGLGLPNPGAPGARRRGGATRGGQAAICACARGAWRSQQTPQIREEISSATSSAQKQNGHRAEKQTAQSPQSSRDGATTASRRQEAQARPTGRGAALHQCSGRRSPCRSRAG